MLILFLCIESSLFGIAYAEEVPAEEPTDTTEEPQYTEDTQATENTEEPEEPQETVIETGDAVAGADVANVSNTNEVDTEASATSTEELFDESDEVNDVTENSVATSTDDNTASSSDNNASSTSEVLINDDPEVGEEVLTESEDNTEQAADTAIENDNQSTTTNSADVGASTGSNSAENGDLVTIDTGDAFAYANIVNVANTNIINSNGFLLFFSQLFGLSTLDLRSIFDIFGGGGDSSCDLSKCDDDDVSMQVSNTNDATITNDVVVRASTGGNTASGDDAVIFTGDAYAFANLINVANTNIIDSNYLVLSFSNFGDFAGDFVLPNASFFNNLFSSASGVSGDLTVTNNNTATITNAVNVGAETGDNTATSSEDGSAVIETGDATANANVFNYTNTNAIGGTSFMMIFRVHGDWTGDVFGLPEGLLWAETPAGIELYTDPEYGGGGSGGPLSDLTVTNNNSASITNNVDVFALTGENKVSGDSFGGIATGDATAAANITNIANTNILSRNWALLIFDIFGDWDGNIAFGRPNLWLGATANSHSNPVSVGSRVDYTFTITNFGDTDATEVALDGFFEEGQLAFNDDIHSWDIGKIRAGETVELVRSAIVGENIPYGAAPLSLTAEVSARENEDDLEDNTDIVTVMTARKVPGGGGGAPITFESGLDVSKTISASTANPGSTVSYTINIENAGGPSFYSVLVDTIYDEEDNIIAEQTWDLGTILTDESITVTYDVQFSGDILPGVYENSAQVYAYDKSPSLNYAEEVDSNVASVELLIEGPISEVLGEAVVEEGAYCSQYITQYMSVSRNNTSPDVLDLQRFLREYEGFSELELTGIFDQPTDRAVRAFQNRYHEDILDPWGIANDTGVVYYTTQKKINEIYCGYEATFPLTESQKREIALYKSPLFSPYLANNGQGDSDDQMAENVTDTPAQLPEPAIVQSAEQDVSAVEDTDASEQLSRRSRSFRELMINVYSWLRASALPDISIR